MDSKVTILIPTYNRAGYLQQAMDSALEQTYPDIEIVILDDASLDHTSEVVAFYAKEPSLRYIRHQSNGGIVKNWKAGIEAAQGEFFCFLHDDDTFEPEFVEKLVKPLQDDHDMILAFSDHWVMNEKGMRLQRESEEASRRFRRSGLTTGRVMDFPQAALVDMAVPVGATIFRKSMATASLLCEDAKGSVDAWLFYQCVKMGHGAYYRNERLMNYRIHDSGMSASQPLYMAEGHLFRYRKILQDASLEKWHPAICRLMAETLVGYGISLLRAKRGQEAREALKEALQMQRSRRAIAAYLLACSGSLGTIAIKSMRSHS